MLTGYVLSPDGDWEERIVLALGQGGLSELYSHASKIQSVLAREGIAIEFLGW